MKYKSPRGPWVIITMALLLIVAILILGNQSLKATEKATFDQSDRQLIRSAYLGQLLVVGLSILTVLVGSSYALACLRESYGRVAEEQSKVLAATEASREAIWVSDADLRTVMVNSAMEELTGRRQEELLGQTCRHLLRVRSLDGASICDTICPVLQSADDSGRIEVRLSTPSGKEVWSEISYGRVTDTNGRLAGVVHFCFVDNISPSTQRLGIQRVEEGGSAQNE